MAAASTPRNTFPFQGGLPTPGPRAGLTGFTPGDSPFRALADAQLAAFREARDAAARAVRAGDLGARKARETLAEQAERVRASLADQARAFRPPAAPLADRLAATADARRKGKEGQGLEALQRETIALLRANLIEQQVTNRAREFEARAFVRAGGRPDARPAPTVAGLLAFHEQATRDGDPAAQEWARRQLEALRPLAADAAEAHRIDEATDRPDLVNPRTVARIVDALKGAESDRLDAFVSRSLDDGDANRLAAAYLLARDEDQAAPPAWAARVLAGLDRFPDAALAALRQGEADASEADARAALDHAEHAALQIASLARLDGVEPPTAAEMAAIDRARSLPPALPGESIGLHPVRRGVALDPDDGPAS